MSKYAPRYFKIDWDVASKDWELVLSVDSSMENLALIISSSSKLKHNSFVYIANYATSTQNAKDLIAFSYLPVSADLSIFDLETVDIIDFNTLVGLLPDLLKKVIGMDTNITMEGITEITEDKYYKID